ncbi:MAG: NAD(P)H-hydrate dehydratase [Anaerolineae bacterium]|nr:NAD(P)H-hydrate dehydratase [Anaerolineae bacterium]
MRILSVSEMRALETTTDMAGHSYAQMMEMAGKGVALAVLQHVLVKGHQILVLVGPGNNGGDGLVAARLLQNAGGNVVAYLARPRDAEKDINLRLATEAGVQILVEKPAAKQQALGQQVRQCQVLIDALLGTGATLPLRGILADILSKVQESLHTVSRTTLTSLNVVPARESPRPFIIAVDGPSSLDFDTGAVDQYALKAHVTVTFAAPKWGHFSFPGAEYVGELVVADIGIPEGIEVPDNRTEVATPALIRSWLPARPLNAHKGTFGKALIVAGSVNYTGAAALSASAAVRAGAGLVTLAAPNLLHSALVPLVPEATYLLLPHSLGVLDAPAVPVLLEKITDYSALLVGPGLSHTPETTAFVRGLLGLSPRKRGAGFLAEDEPPTQCERSLPPLVVDADGLNILSEMDDWHTLLPAGSILTPHLGEMARLTQLPVEEIQSHRLDIARKYARKWGHVVVLKGAFTLIAAPGGESVLLPFANPGLSSAGVGDVLAGCIVGLCAQGLDAFKAAVTGAYLHGFAGELVRQSAGTAGIVAGDIARALPEARCRLA